MQPQDDRSSRRRGASSLPHERLANGCRDALRSLRYALEAAKLRWANGGREPVLVYQMGKVGSSSVERTLKSIGCDAVHVHHLNPTTRAAVRRQHERQSLPLPAHFGAADLVLTTLLGRRRLRIVTLVREPVARNVSAYFQNIRVFGHDPAQLSSERVEELTRQFLEQYPHDVPLRWFDEEFLEVLGVDVYRHPFPQSAGHQILDTKQARILILQTELDDAAKEQALGRFLDLPSPPELLRANVGSKKAYKDVYAAFLERLRLPAEYLERMYGSRYARHFYSDDQRASFRRRWATSGADPDAVKVEPAASGSR